MQKRELQRLRTQLSAVEQKVKRREELKDDIVKRRVAQLTDVDSELQWDTVEAPASTLGYGDPFATADPFGTTHPSSSRPASSPLEPADVRGAQRGNADPNPPSVPSLDLATTYLGPVTMTPREAKVRLKMAQEKLAQIDQMFKRGIIPVTEMTEARQDSQLAELNYQNALQQHAVRLKLLELEIAKANSAAEAAGSAAGVC